MVSAEEFIEIIQNDIADKKRFLDKLNNGESLLDEELYIRQWLKNYDNI